MRILGIDPDSKVMGWAVYNTRDPDRWEMSGVIRECKCGDAGVRIARNTSRLWGLMADLTCHAPLDHCVIESPGRVPAKATSVESLQKQSIGVGAAFGAAVLMLGRSKVRLIDASQWTRGRSKAERVEVHRLETGYTGESGSHDVDARMLAEWWSIEAVLLEASK